MSAPDYTILVIDDDPYARETLAALLNKPAYRVELAADGVEGLELAKAIVPDVILLDVMMPRMNGYDVCRRIRADENLKEAPILMITALDDRESRLNGLVAGADDFLSKPVDSFELEVRLHTMRRVNRYRQLLKEREKLNETLAELSRERAALQSLSRMLMEAQENERRRVAMELHDEVGQLVTGLKLILERGGADPSAALSEARAVANQIFQRLREISVNLRPTDLDDFGLSAALTSLFKRFTQQTGIAIRHNINPLDGTRFDKAVETAIFRVTQEALTNVARHAGVYEANVHLSIAPHQVQIRISDSGKGFDPNSVDWRASTGLSGMAERVAMAGGQFNLHSAPNNGVAVVAEFQARPLTKTE